MKYKKSNTTQKYIFTRYSQDLLQNLELMLTVFVSVFVSVRLYLLSEAYVGSVRLLSFAPQVTFIHGNYVINQHSISHDDFLRFW